MMEVKYLEAQQKLVEELPSLGIAECFERIFESLYTTVSTFYSMKNPFYLL